MLKSTPIKAAFFQALMMLSLVSFAVPAYAGVVLEENFDAQANWNANNQYEDVESQPLDPNAPPNWTFFRNMPGAAGFSPVVSINQIPNGSADKTGNGKAMIKYNESYPNANYPGDGILGKYWPTENFKEIYVRFWMKTQPGWQTAAGHSSKIFRLFHFDGGAGDNIFNFFSSGNSAPIYIYCLASASSGSSGPNKAEYMSLYRVDPQESNYYPPSSAPWYEQVDYYFGWNGKVGSSLSNTTWSPWVNATDPGVYADGNWHRFDFHLKLNDIGSANGIMEYTYDGVLKESHNDVVWKMSGSSASIGWNAVGFGGNSDNTYSSTPAEEWYAIDDIVVSTTPIPEDYAIGGGPIADVAAPSVAISAPAANATVSGTYSVTASASDNVGVSKVEFYLNGALQASDTTTPYLFSWNTATVANGSYSLSVKAYDAAGNVGQSAALTVNVNNVAADTSAPTVTITAPANGATVSGNVAFAVSASDNVKVSKVEFFDNGVLSAVVNATPYSYTWNTAAAVNGSHTLTSKAYDAAGNIGQAASIQVTVNNVVADTTAPAVAISSPASGATISGMVNITASASDSVGVSKVEFYVNGVLKATDTTAPFSFSWDSATVANGSYSLSARAFDAAGNIGQSGSVTANVNNSLADSSAPTVAISSPAASASVTGVVVVNASASDNVAIKKVEFYINGVLQATDTAAPYSYSWNSTAKANGSYILSARAYDAAGNVGQSAEVSVSVNNVAAVNSSIWSASAVPSVQDSGPDNSVELGVKFKSDLKGYITGIRFYKASTNSGSHVASLWTKDGRLLARATFTAESASGWQQVNFSAPVAIAANTVYVASYHTNVGHYSADYNFFSSRGVDNGSLHALVNGGVYAYGSSSRFPNQTFQGSNYWVDVVFKK